MNRIWIISDTHFGHSKVLEFEPIARGRHFRNIQEHDAQLIENWNSVVKKNDTVWHLGDVAFGRSALECIGKCNGIKKLVMGNHDQYPIAEYAKYFSRICAGTKFHETIFTHIPIHPSQFYRFKQNIHGHLHSDIIPDSRYRNVSVERTNLTPILLDEVLYKDELCYI